MAEQLYPEGMSVAVGQGGHYVARLVTPRGKERWRCQHKHNSLGAAEYCAGRAARKREIARQQGYAVKS